MYLVFHPLTLVSSRTEDAPHDDVAVFVVVGGDGCTLEEEAGDYCMLEQYAIPRWQQPRPVAFDGVVAGAGAPKSDSLWSILLLPTW